MDKLNLKLGTISIIAFLAFVEIGLPIEAYMLIRYAICALFIFTVSLHGAEIANLENGKFINIGFIVFAIIFNPFVPFYFGRELWKLIDVIVIGSCIYTFWLRYREQTDYNQNGQKIRSGEVKLNTKSEDVDTGQTEIEQKTNYDEDEEDFSFGRFFGPHEPTAPFNFEYYVSEYRQLLDLFFYCAISDGKIDTRDLNKIGYVLMRLSRGSHMDIHQVKIALIKNRPRKYTSSQHKRNFDSAMLFLDHYSQTERSLIKRCCLDLLDEENSKSPKQLELIPIIQNL